MRTLRLSSTALLAVSILIPAVFCLNSMEPIAFAQSPAAASTAITPLITEAIDESRLTTLAGNTYPKAKPQFDLGTAPASLPMERMLLVLKRSAAQEFTLRKLLDDQQDKSSPQYHNWLKPEEFGQQFGPTDADMQTITHWLQSHGFQVESTKGRTVLEFSGSASQVEEAFHAPIHKYLVNGEQHWANASDPKIPTALVPAVAGIVSLHNFPRKAMNNYVGRYSAKTRQLTSPLYTYTVSCENGETCPQYALGPYDFATIYDVLPLWNAGISGTGQSIAIVGRSDINPADPTTFWQIFGLTVPSTKLNVIVNGPDPGFTSDENEADIDIQWSGAVAPQATIDFVTSATTSTTDGIDLSAVYIVDNNLAPVLSESYGECELGIGDAGNQFYYGLWAQAAAQGISVFISTGDNGAAGCDAEDGPSQYGLNVNGIASTPFDAAIGGTDFNQYKIWTTYWNSTNAANTQESAKSYIPETTWNNSCTNSLFLTLGLGSTAEQICNNATAINGGAVISNGGSGGPSNCILSTNQEVGSCTAGYTKPSWQKGTGVPADNMRDLPDASLFASNGFLSSFYEICQQDATGGICDLNDLAGYGGTSVASPAFAGIMSLVNQKTGNPQGVPGFSLYQLVSKQPNAFHDVPAGSTIAMPCVTGTPNCVTTTNGDTYGVLSGYNTGTGFDLATGLGSVDAANLVNNWNKATFTATTATLQLNNGTAVNVTHGAAVPISIGINPTAATGDAALLINTGPGTTTGKDLALFPLTGGSTSTTTSLLPGGTYSVVAHYVGDGTYGGSYSTPVSVTVNKENSQPAVFVETFDYSGNVVNPDTTTAVYGSPYALRVNINNAADQLCTPGLFPGSTGCPTGDVSMTNNGVTLGAGSFALNNSGYFVDSTVQLPAGTDSVTAAYAGDNSFNASTATSAITITPATTNASLSSNMTRATVGQQFYLYDSIQAESFGAFPTGAVAFKDNGNTMPGTVTYQTLNCGNTDYVCLNATLITSVSSSGTHSVTASYPGDGNYTAASASLSMPAQFLPTVTLSSSAQTVAAGSSVTLTALVDANVKSPALTGTVAFVGTPTAITGTPTIVSTTDSKGNSVLQATLTITVSSSETVTAQYPGDENYTYAASAVDIYVPDFSVFTNPAQLTLTQGQSQTAQVAVTPTGGFNGTFSFACSAGLPTGATCSFSPAQIQGQGWTTMTVTTAPLGQARRRAALQGPNMGWIASAMFLMLGTCAIVIPSRQRRALLPKLIILSLFVSIPGCGGSGGGGTPPPQNNPVPTIASLSPTQQAAGSIAQALTINGTSFINTSTVTYNGAPHTPTFISPTQLSIPLTTTDLGTAGDFPVVVTNPAPGGGPSSGIDFDVLSTGTPTGTFPVTVSATSGSLTHTTTFTLVVQ